MDVKSLSKRSKWLALGVAAVVIAGGLSFLVGRQLADRGSAAAQVATAPVAPPVSDSVTPAPGATPDRSQPNWYVPYLNRDRDLPKFSGTINGILIGDSARAATGPAACATTPNVLLGDEAAAASDASPLAIRASAIQGVKPSSALTATVCEGEVIQVEEHFDAIAGTAGVNSGGGAVTITSQLGGGGTDLQAPASRWSPGTVAGHPAAFLTPVIDTVGTSAVVVLSKANPPTELTIIRGAGVTVQFLATLGEGLYR